MKYYFNFRENGDHSKLFKTKDMAIIDQANYQSKNPEIDNLRITIDTKTETIKVEYVYI